MDTLETKLAAKVRALPDHVLAQYAADNLTLGEGAVFPSVAHTPSTSAAKTNGAGAAKPGAAAPAEKKATGKPAQKKPSSAGGKADKRTPAVFASQMEDIVDHIGKNSGAKAEEIGKALHLSSKELALPVRKLLADGKIRKEGEKRATKYYPVEES